MLTSIIILTYNKIDFTRLCIESIRKYTEIGTYELIVVDNASTDGTVEWLKDQPDLKLILNQSNQGFPKGCNQGIQIATGDNILLLNNDTIVTQDWLEQLVLCLYSSEDIGAVGPITNSSSYAQAIEVPYQSIDEMHRFAYDYNLSDPKKWEDRLKLIGYCMLIKKEVINKIGLLDERFTPGNYEDDDYSIRILQLGYRLILCKDTFIHHFGSISWREDVGLYGSLLNENQIKFERKWGFNPDRALAVQFEILDLITLSQDKEINILDICCGAGGTLLALKNRSQQVNLYGLEENAVAANIARSFAKVQIGNLENTDLGFFEGHFDYVLLSNSIEFSSDPVNLLKKAAKCLKPTGMLLAKASNLIHYDRIRKLLNGNLVNTNATQRLYTFTELETYLSNAGFHSAQFIKYENEKSAADQTFIENLSAISNPIVSQQFGIQQYWIIARLNQDETREISKSYVNQDGDEHEDRTFIFRLRRIENGIEPEENLKFVIEELISRQIPIEHLIELIGKETIQKVKLLNLIALSCYQIEAYDYVLPLFQKALEFDQDHADTLYNLGYFLYRLKQNQLAKHYLHRITAKDKDVLELLDEITKEEAI